MPKKGCGKLLRTLLNMKWIRTELEAPDDIVIWFSRYAALSHSFDCIHSEALKKKSCSKKDNVERCFSIATSIVFGWSFIFFWQSSGVSDSCFAFLECWMQICLVLFKLPCLPCYNWALRDIQELCLNLNLPCCSFPCKHRTFSCPHIPCSVSCQDMDAEMVHALLPLQFLESLLASLHGFGFFQALSEMRRICSGRWAWNFTLRHLLLNCLAKNLH